MLRNELKQKKKKIARLKSINVNEEDDNKSDQINFTGNYQLVSSENFEKYLKDCGYSYLTRKIGTKLNLTVNIIHNEDKFHYTMQIQFHYLKIGYMEIKHIHGLLERNIILQEEKDIR